MIIKRDNIAVQLTKEELAEAWMEYQQMLNKEEDIARRKTIRKNLQMQELINRISEESLEIVLDKIVEQVRTNQTEYGSNPEYEMAERLEDILDNVLTTIEYESFENSKTNMTFTTNENMVEAILNDVDLYNVLTGEYIFKYNETGSIAVYDISLEEAKKLEEKSQRSNEYWGAYLGVGGIIYDEPSKYCREKYNIAGWIDVTPGH